MKRKKVLKCFIVGLITMMGVTVLVPYAFSYLSSVQDKGISIRAAPASEIWEIQGSFDQNRWKDSNASGIYIQNKSSRDLVIYYEYTGNLKQVFKHSDPVLVPAGEKKELMFYPLDDKDSPRLLNPLDLIESTDDNLAGKSITELTWKEFSGKIIVHTLNYYASLESGEINISAKTLWDMLFARKYGEEPKTYYETKWKVEMGTSGLVSGDNLLTQAQSNGIIKNTINNTVQSDKKFNEEEIRSYLQGLNDFKGLKLEQPVIDVINTMAPGLLKEHIFLYQAFCGLQDRAEIMLNEIDNLLDQVAKLTAKITDLEATISKLNDRINNLEQDNADLNRQLQNAIEEAHEAELRAANSTSTAGQSGGTGSTSSSQSATSTTPETTGNTGGDQSTQGSSVDTSEPVTSSGQESPATETGSQSQTDTQSSSDANGSNN